MSKMEEKARCEICNREFKDLDGLAAHNKAKHSESMPRERKSLPVKRIRNWSIFILIFGLIVTGIVWSVSGIEKLPPTDIDGHIESNPSSHVLKEPIPIEIQKHMLEHVGGIEGGRGGVVINYNCKDYICGSSLIADLEAFADKYDYVYVAPFKGMDAKIALTKLGKIEVLEEYDESLIINFIDGK